MTCEAARPAPLRCPTEDERIAMTLALLPHGRAWGSDNGQVDADSVIGRFFSVLAALLNFAETRLCDLRLEFFCASAAETRDLWMREYDLPDACDPFPDLCSKVAALGGARCEYYAAIAARAGWSIACLPPADDCGAEVGCAEVGCDVAGGGVAASTLRILVDLTDSPAYTGRLTSGQPIVGDFEVGGALDCDADISPLRCIMSRIVHAHVTVTYEILPLSIFIVADEQVDIGDEDGNALIAE